MDPRTPRLLIVDVEGIPAPIIEALGGEVEVEQVVSSEAVQRLGAGPADAVLISSGSFLPLERALVSLLSSELLHGLRDGLCVCDDAGSRLWSNNAFDALPERIQERVFKGCADRVRPKRTLPPNEIRRTEDERAYEIGYAPLRVSETGLATHFASIVRDVSEREGFSAKINALNAAGDELLHFDAKSVAELNAAQRLELLEQRVVASAHELLEFDHFAIRLLNRSTNALELVMSHGMPDAARDIELYALAEKNGISGFVAVTGESYLCPDTSSEERYVVGMENAGSSITVPLKLFDEVVGVFDIERAEPNAFSEPDLQFAELFGHYVALALHMLQLLLAERTSTSARASGTIAGEVSKPIEHLIEEVQAMKRESAGDDRAQDHLDQILRDTESIRRRIERVGAGPQTLLGVEEAIAGASVDPILESRRILVVDDEHAIRSTMRDVLEKRGASVVACDSGASALALLEQWALTHDADEGFHVIISDINLGDGTTGYDVFSAAKRASESVPVILVTGFGYDPNHTIVRASQEGLRSVLFKPFQATKLVDEVRGAIAGDQA
ncbi:MAG: response regulator [Planctomycetota bacterium]